MLLLKLTWFFVLVIVLKILQCPYSLMHFNVRNKIYKSLNLWYILLLFSCSVMSDSLWPHGLQHTRLLCLSPSPTACSNSCPSSQLCHSTISSLAVPFSSCVQSFPASGSFSNESVLCINWPKYLSFSFSISPSNEYSGLISFRMDWLDLLAVQGILESLLQHHSSKASILRRSAFFIF